MYSRQGLCQVSIRRSFHLKMLKSSAAPSQKNIHAILQQRRLRHINGICFRNLKLSAPKTVKTSRKLYFTILDGRTEQASVIYRSDGIDICSNPSWLGITLAKTMHSSCNILHLELWMQGPCDEDQQRLLHWEWDLLKLRYIAERLYHGEIKFASNALILQISGSFYSLTESFSTDTPHGNCPPFSLDEEKVSYNVFSIRRMVTSQKSIAISKVRSTSYVTTCENSLKDRESMTTKVKLIEDLRTRNKMLKLLLNREQMMLKSETDHLHECEIDTEERDKALMQHRDSLANQCYHYSSVVKQSQLNQQKTIALNRDLSARRLEVLSELAYIFPILPYKPPTSTKSSSRNLKHSANSYPNFVICDIHLPDAESLHPKEDAKNAVAMGYVSQMLHMISSFLVIPLRYPLLLQGSQTAIVDNIIDKVQEKERVFPLYVRSNKERFLFEYGVYLLNKDIAQLRFLLGILTNDLRPTLLNLKSLLQQATGNVQPVRTITVQPSPRSKSPVNHRSPIAQRKQNDDVTVGAVDDADPDPVTSNGLVKPSKLEEKVHDKSVELSSLRGELFGNKKSKSIPVSPHRNISTNSVPPSISSSTGSPTVKKGSGGNVSVVVTNSPEVKAPFLTGLEDLESSPKEKNDPKKPLDVVAARNELFKTKSGRLVVSRKKAAFTGFDSKVTNNNITLKGQVSKSRSSTAHSTGSSESTNSIDRTVENFSNLTGVKSDDSVPKTGPSSHHNTFNTDILDLC